MTLPNLISLARLLAVPLVVWLLLNQAYFYAFGLFVFAAVSDAVDGFIAKRFQLSSMLGAYLDPIADKALLVSIYITLGHAGVLPSWLVILVVSRDILIVGAVLLSFTLDQPVTIRPLLISKVNTLGQLCLAAFVLASLAVALPDWKADVLAAGSVLVGLTTILSGGTYLVVWLRSMGALGKAT